MRQEDAPYLDALAGYAERDAGRYHVPGHKGRMAAHGASFERFSHVLGLDIPACTRGIDVGPHPTPLVRAAELAAEAWGGRRTWFLVNGASEGSHAVCVAVAQLGDGMVVQRNAHSSVIHGLVLSGLRPTFIAPEVDASLGIAHCVDPAALDRTLGSTPTAAAAFVVSPTYFGAAADLRKLAEVAHNHGVPLVVDEAWGAHFRFHEGLPEDALSAGADLVISGTHKLMGSLTQSAMLHLSRDVAERIDERTVDRALGLIRSTSPSSLLLGSLDAARRHATLHAHHLLSTGIEDMEGVRQAIEALPGLSTLDSRLEGRWAVHSYDPYRLAIDVSETEVDGHVLAAALHRVADVNLELATATVLIAHFGLGEPVEEQGTRLVDALSAALAKVGKLRNDPCLTEAAPPWGELAMSPREAFFAPREVLSLKDAVGRVSTEAVCVYPPGIPNVMPGERFTAETVEHLRSMIERGCVLRGTSGDEPDEISVTRSKI